MSAWTCLEAAARVSYDAQQNSIRYAPVITPQSFSCFCITAGGWGQYSQTFTVRPAPPLRFRSPRSRTPQSSSLQQGTTIFSCAYGTMTLSQYSTQCPYARLSSFPFAPPPS
jgi:hypothetical protein